MQDRSPLNLTSSLQLGIQVKCFKLSETSSKFCLLSPTSQILWSQQHFCPPHLTVLACISNFLPPMDSIYSYRHISSDERVVLIRNPILFNVNRDVDLIHFFCNHIWVVSCAMWWTFIAQSFHTKTIGYSVLFWFRVPKNRVNSNFIQSNVLN